MVDSGPLANSEFADKLKDSFPVHTLTEFSFKFLPLVIYEVNQRKLNCVVHYFIFLKDSVCTEEDHASHCICW